MHFSRLSSFAVGALALFVPALCSAHQPVLVMGSVGAVIVQQPEQATAYYDELAGLPRTYILNTSKEFPLSVAILVPESSNPAGRYGAMVERVAGGHRSVIATLDALGTWQKLYEPFGADWYLQGPSWQDRLPAGRYEITVSGMNNLGKYVLAVGAEEHITLSEEFHSLLLMPQLKSTFFLQHPITFLRSPAGIAELAVVCLCSLVCSWLLHRRFRKRRLRLALPHPGKNIGSRDRWLRAAVAALLLFIGLFWWTMLAVFAGVFCLYEALAGWCGLYAFLGRDTCPLA